MKWMLVIVSTLVGAVMTFVLIDVYGWLGAIGSVWFVVEVAFLVGFARDKGFGGADDYTHPDSGDSW